MSLFQSTLIFPSNGDFRSHVLSMVVVALVKDPDGEGTRDTSQEQTFIRFGHKWWIIGCGFSLQGHLPTMGVGGGALFSCFFSCGSNMFYLQQFLLIGFVFEMGSSSVVQPGLEFQLSCLSLVITQHLPSSALPLFIGGLFSVFSLEVSHTLWDVFVESSQDQNSWDSVSFGGGWKNTFWNHCLIFINQPIWRTSDCFKVFQMANKNQIFFGYNMRFYYMYTTCSFQVRELACSSSQTFISS